MNFNYSISRFILSIIIIVTLTFNLSKAFAAVGVSYFVSNSGNDANPGTRSKPFKSVDKINSLQLRAGDTVYFKSGQTFPGSLTLRSSINGTQLKPVVFTAYGAGNAMIDSKDSSAIRIYKNSYIKLERLSLHGSGRKTGNVKDGLAAVSCHHIGIKDIDISGFQKSGLLMYSCQNVIADRVFAHDNGSAGITVEALIKPGRAGKSKY